MPSSQKRELFNKIMWRFLKHYFWRLPRVNLTEPNSCHFFLTFKGETDFIKIFKLTLVERYHLGLLLERQQCLVRWSNVPSLINFVNFSISKLNFDFGNIASEIGLQKSSFRNRAPGKVLKKKAHYWEGVIVLNSASWITL